MCYNAVGNVPSALRLEVVDKAMKRFSIDVPNLVRAYEGGETVLNLSRRLGVSRPVIVRRLHEAGIPIRGPKEAQTLRMARLSPDERQRITAAAHDAVRGKRQTLEARINQAIGREKGGKSGSPYEQLLACWLRERGITATIQKAIGPYNADLAFDSVAVEVYGGGWHDAGRHAARARERFDYLFDAGWRVFIIRVEHRHRLMPAVADDLIAFAQTSGADPAGGREYRVVWGDGQPMPATGFNHDDFTLIRSGSRRDDVTGRYQGAWS